MSAYAAYGLTSAEDARDAESFEHWAKSQGWAPEQIEATFIWYRDVASKAQSPVDLLESFYLHSDKIGLDPEMEIAADEWLVDVGENNGPEPPRLTTAPEDAERAGEIQKMMHDDPDSYWRDPTAQREYQLIAERQKTFGDADAKPAELGATAARARKEEIRETMKTDIDRYRREGMDVEYEGLLRAESEQPIDTGGLADNGEPREQTDVGQQGE